MIKSLVRKLNPKAGSLAEYFLVLGVVGAIVSFVLWSIRGGLSTVTQNIMTKISVTMPYEGVLALIIIVVMALLILGLISFASSISKK